MPPQTIYSKQPPLWTWHLHLHNTVQSQYGYNCAHINPQNSRTWGCQHHRGHSEAWVHMWPFKQVKATSISLSRAFSALPYCAVHVQNSLDTVTECGLGFLGLQDCLQLPALRIPMHLRCTVCSWLYCLVRPFEVPAGQFPSLGRGFRPTCYNLPAIIMEKSIKNCLWSYRSCWSRGGVVSRELSSASPYRDLVGNRCCLAVYRDWIFRTVSIGTHVPLHRGQLGAEGRQQSYMKVEHP